MNTEFGLGGKIYWADLAKQLATVWWKLNEIGGNLQHGDLDTDTTFSIVLPAHGGQCFHADTPMDVWQKARKWLMSPDRPRSEPVAELPTTLLEQPSLAELEDPFE